MDISKTGFRRLDTFARSAVIHSVAVTFGEYERGCASTIRFETAPQDYGGHDMAQRDTA